MDSQDGREEDCIWNYANKGDIDEDINAQRRQLPQNCLNLGKG